MGRKRKRKTSQGANGPAAGAGRNDRTARAARAKDAAKEVQSRQRERLTVVLVALVAFAAVLTAALSLHGRSSPPRVLEILYPPNHALFPPEIVPPEFRWHQEDPVPEAWLITVSFGDDGPPLTARTEACRWTPSEAQWQEIRDRCAGQEAKVLISGLRGAADDDVVSAGKIAIGVSTDEVGASLFYREVNLPFADAVRDPSQIQWRFGAVSCRERPRQVLTGLPVCGNCHSFSADGTWLGMDVDYANDRGSYALTRVEEQTVLDAEKILTWSDYERDENEPTFGLLSQVSPDGNYVVSTVKDRSVFVAKPEIEFSQLFFPIKGILAVYSRRTKTFAALPGADDPEYVQSNPVWSADGKRIFFARSKAYVLSGLRDQGKVLLTEEECAEFLRGGETFQYDLYSVPFNEGRGGEAEPLRGASNNGMSNYFPKCSPDGRWIVFCKAKSFMLLQPDSELYVLPVTGGAARRLRCNTGRMNSWHSWSPNSRWLVFSSKARGPYTQLFLTHIDQEGRSTPPVVLDRFSSSDRAANIPEFVNLPPDAIRQITERFTDDHSYWRAGNEFLLGQDWKNAESMFRKALAANPQNINAQINLGAVLTHTERVEEGIEHLQAALEIDPRSAEAHQGLAAVLAVRGQVDEAIDHCRKALEIEPGKADTRNTLGAMLLVKGKIAEATAELRHAIELDPRNAKALANLGRVEAGTGQFDLAADHFRRSLQLQPAGDIYQALATILVRQGKRQEVGGLCEQAAGSLPATAENHYHRGRMWQIAGQPAEAIAQYRAALELDAGHQGAGHQLGLVLASTGQTADAIRQYRRVLERYPDHRQTLGNLARLLATASDPACRDGAEAVRLAEKAAGLADAQNFIVLDTLAAAYAEANRWDDAATTQEQAIHAAESQSRLQAVPPMRKRLGLYKSRQPWRE